MDDDDPVAHVGVVGEAGIFAGVDQLAVHLVAEDEDGFVLQDLVDGIQRLPGVDPASGIVGGGEDDGLGLIRDGGGEPGGIDLKIVVLGGEVHGHAAAHLRDGLVQTEGRGGDDDLVAGIENGEQGREKSLGGTAGDDDLLGIVMQAVALRFKSGNGAAEVDFAVVVGVVGVVGVQSGLDAFLDIFRRVEIRLTDGEHHGTGGAACQRRELTDAGGLQTHHGGVESQFHKGHTPVSENFC